MADLRRNLERQMIFSGSSRTKCSAKIGVTDDEARKYYESHLNDFTTPPTVTLREILVRPGDAKGLNVAADEAAKAKAERDPQTRDHRRRELREARRARYPDSPSKANAGLIGPLSVNDISPDLRKLIEGMKAGDVSEPVRTRARLSVVEARNDHDRRRR